MNDGRHKWSNLAHLAAKFCEEAPHRGHPFSKRNWGAPLHSLCSYQGKLKPAIAHFLISRFTDPGDRILDPLAGVGTIPLEARRLGRVGIANDMSPLAAIVCRAKLEPFETADVTSALKGLTQAIDIGFDQEHHIFERDVQFGLNGPISDYFHPKTLRELLIARQFLLSDAKASPVARDILWTCLLHILHGNRPYALSRRSHPVTPFAPTGPYEYKSLTLHVETRLAGVLPLLEMLCHSAPSGTSHRGDFRMLEVEPVDAVITSPPFARSLRFWSSNWMRLWFAGWSPSDFRTEPRKYLETEQRSSYAPYQELAGVMSRWLKPNGLLIMHLGETAASNMVEGVVPQLHPYFDVKHVGREGVEDTESHGIRDKTATSAHWYLFAVRTSTDAAHE